MLIKELILQKVIVKIFRDEKIIKGADVVIHAAAYAHEGLSVSSQI